MEKYKLNEITDEALVTIIGGSNNGFWTGFGYVIGKTARVLTDITVRTIRNPIIIWVIWFFLQEETNEVKNQTNMYTILAMALAIVFFESATSMFSN